MGRITDIISNARDLLSDPNGVRWSDTRLLRALNSGIKEIVLQTHCLKERIYVELEANAVFYDLSDYVIQFLRVQYLTKNIDAKTHAELDMLNPRWQEDEGTEVKYVTFDALPEGYLRIYPMLTDASDNVTQNQTYGGLIDLVINDQLFQAPSIGDIEVGMSKYLVIHAVKKPAKVLIDTLDVDLELDSIYDTALEHYITASMFRSDTDAKDKAFGDAQLKMFYETIESLRQLTTSKSGNTVSYRTLSYIGFPK